MKLTYERLIEVLDYDKHTGLFRWKISTARKIKIGDQAGWKHSKGYIVISIDNESFYAQDLAWFFEKCEWPSSVVDHKDTIRDNNIFSNLRLGTKSQNSQNVNIHRDNLIGFKGVAQNRKKFSAKIYVNGKNIHLGTFPSKEEAAHKYDEAAITYFGPFARTNKSMGLLP
jgi:hypothetical protein